MVEKRLMFSPIKGMTERIIGTATLIKRGVCPCGFPTIADHIPTGKVYKVVLDSKSTMTLNCGGCKQDITVDSIMVQDGNGPTYRALPLELFELEIV